MMVTWRQHLVRGLHPLGVRAQHLHPVRPVTVPPGHRVPVGHHINVSSQPMSPPAPRPVLAPGPAPRDQRRPSARHLPGVAARGLAEAADLLAHPL